MNCFGAVMNQEHAYIYEYNHQDSSATEYIVLQTTEMLKHWMNCFGAIMNYEHA